MTPHWCFFETWILWIDFYDIIGVSVFFLPEKKKSPRKNILFSAWEWPERKKLCPRKKTTKFHPRKKIFLREKHRKFPPEKSKSTTKFLNFCPRKAKFSPRKNLKLCPRKLQLPKKMSKKVGEKMIFPPRKKPKKSSKEWLLGHFSFSRVRKKTHCWRRTKDLFISWNLL